MTVTVPVEALVGDLNADGKVDCLDFAVVKAAFGKQSGQPGFDLRADVNGDGVVNVEDLSIVTQQLPVGTSCDVQTPGGEQANHPPVANAGADQSVSAGTAATLDGTGSSDPDGNPLTFRWTQTAGPAITLNAASSATPTFTAPAVSTDTALTFQLLVNDGTTDSMPAQVTITVKALPAGGGNSGGGGGCTLNPGAQFDPMMEGMIGLLVVHLVWQRLRKRSLSSTR